MQSERDISIKAADIRSEGMTAVKAGRNLTVENGKEITDLEEHHRHKERSLLSSTTTTTHDEVHAVQAQKKHNRRKYRLPCREGKTSASQEALSPLPKKQPCQPEEISPYMLRKKQIKKYTKTSKEKRPHRKRIRLHHRERKEKRRL